MKQKIVKDDRILNDDSYIKVSCKSDLNENILDVAVERIPKEDIIPIYFNKKCVGYYHREDGRLKTSD